MNLQGRDLKLDLSGDDVKLLQSELLRLNVAIPPEEVARATFGVGTRDAVAKLQKAQGLPATGIVDAATVGMLNKLADTPTRTPGAATAASFTVSGRVYDSQRAAVGALELRIVDKNAGPDIVLAKGTTNADGSFSVQYATGPVVEAGKPAPDLQVQALVGDTVAGVSEVRYDAPAVTVLNVQLDPGASAKLPSEHESLVAAIGRFYKGRLGQLQERSGRSDITYLANKTGWDARAVALAALGDQFSAETRIPPMFFYALFRAGMPANSAAIFRSDAKTLTSIWKNAIQQGMLPESAADVIPRIVGQFQEIGAQKMLSTPVLAGTSTFTEILGSAGLQEEQQRQFSQLYIANRTHLPGFWKAVTHAFGEETSASLQFTGKMAFLTLNNAPLMKAVTEVAGDKLSDPAQLAAAGFHDPARWMELLKDAVPVPTQIPGDSPAAQRKNYAAYLSAQLRLSYPTLCMGQLVQSGTFGVKSADAVGRFLIDHQAEFVFGSQAIEQYLARNKLSLDAGAVADIKRLHRVHQITANDSEMTALLGAQLDSAWRIVQYDRGTFTKTFSELLGGADAAAQIYNKAVQIHGAVLNVAVSYLTARNSIPIGNSPRIAQPQALKRAVALDAAAGAQAEDVEAGTAILDPAPTPDNAGDVIAYATLDSLFGSMDFCRCEECRSILSPAAYLVDLLLFIDKAADGLENAQDVLLQRRPDIQYLPLTCENTNTPMPYIDVVNEILEYYIANSAKPLSLQGYQGHDTGGTATEDLMASPQYVLDAAYDLLEGAFFPPPLPFHRSLETLRKYFSQFAVPLASAMESLRRSDDLERGTNPYGWRDILMEQLGVSREEYRLLTDSTLTLQQVYGFPTVKSDADTIAALSNGKAFAHRVGISYDELVEVLKTRVINPNSDLIPKLRKLGVTFGDLQALKDGTLADADFLKLLPTGAGAPDAAEYAGDIVAWVRDAHNFARIMGIITLVDPTNSTSGCNFDQLELRYSKPIAGAGDTSTRLGVPEFTRLLRFIRLRRKLGWTVEQTDAAICALYRADAAPLAADDVDTAAKLDAGFLTLLPRLGIVARTLDQLNLSAKRDLTSLLACWSDIDTHGENALYRQMFLSPSVRDQAAKFADNGYGGFLTDSAEKLLPNSEALRGAFNLTGDEFARICTALGFDANTGLTLRNISAIFRRGWLARKLKLSVRELLLLTSLTGLDPFAPPDIAAAAPALPAIGRLVALMQALKASSLKSAAALYLVWNHDLSGKSAPDPAQLTEFARTLRGNFADIDNQFAATDDPTGDVLRGRMTLVYGQDAADAFFALLDDNAVYDTAYTNPTPTLDAAVAAIDARLSYDAFSHRLAHTGVLAAARGAALKGVGGVSGDFKDAVDRLMAQGLDRAGSFFARFPELKPLYDTYVASPDPLEKKRTAMLAAFQPNLARLRKREQALQRLSAAAALDLDSTARLMDPAAPPFALHAQGHADQALLNDVVGVGVAGLLAQFYFRDTATAPIDQSVTADNLDYAPLGANPLPANPAAGAAISVRWQGAIETPDAGFYNLIIEADATATVTLDFDGSAQPLIQNGTVWRNQDALALKAGKLYTISLTVEKVKDRVRLSWETPKRPREVIPARYAYASAALATFADAYVRFLKAASLLSGLGLTAAELAWLATDPHYQVAGDGWLNALATSGDPSGAVATALLKPFNALLDYARIKSALRVDDERLLDVLRDPAAATAQADSPLFTLTQWDKASLGEVLQHLGLGSNVAALANFDNFRRVYDAFAPIQALRLSAARLIAATTNQPDAASLRDFQSALRARYDVADWRDIIKPINDALRVMRRDALIAYILHQMTENPASAHIDTPDKLFEYFLVDVEMECCMQTSRIRHALSSIQLYVERCLMNLEPRVASAAINADQWKWMKRFRVWQANRKVFLFPENWLESELRDDKSPLYKEMESKLLQNDITDDAATSAILLYLAGLADIAKLEPCGMFIEEKDAGADDDIVHVVARSAGAKRKYYYRRYEFGYWTPWEQIKLEIEDNPVVPVVWNHRLMLFWVKILKETPLVQPAAPASPPAVDPALGDITMTQVRQNAKASADSQANVLVRAMLYWSEFYNGQWQSPMTSDPFDPVDLGPAPPQGDGAFSRDDLRIGTDEQGAQLRVTVYGRSAPRSFLLYNTHSLPQQQGVAAPANAPLYGRRRWFDVDSGTFTVKYRYAVPDVPPAERARDVLTAPTDMLAVQPNHPVANIWDAPFFYGDRQGVFYVTSTEQPVWVKDYGGIGVWFDPTLSKIPPLVVEVPQFGFPPKFWGDGGPIGPDPGVIDPLSMAQFIAQGGAIRQGLAVTLPVTYGGVQFGPAGAINLGETGALGGIAVTGNVG